MSTLLTVRDLRFGHGARQLFEGLDLAISRGDRVGLVGHNGSGKSTLLDLLDGSATPDDGRVEMAHSVKLGRVEQFLSAEDAQLSVLDAVVVRLPEAFRDEAYRAEGLLHELGVPDSAWAFAAGDVSGGQQNRLMLARALIAEPDLLLLDEPTNHLDLATMQVIERLLLARPGLSWLLISHDRAFLDAVTNRTLILRDRRLHGFDLPCSAARAALAERDVQDAHRAANEAREIDRLKQSAKRLATWGKTFDNEKFSRQARSMEKRIDRLEETRTEVSQGNPLALQLQVSDTRAQRVLQIDGLDVHPAAAPTAAPLLHVDTLTVRPGERIALLGPNGSGKSSFIAALLDAAADHPHIRISPQARIGYYDQELAQASGRLGMAAWLGQHTDAGSERIKQSLIHAGFAFERHDDSMDSLSGGERARLVFLRLGLTEPNVLILDEPTNHIDMEGREALEAQLQASEATLLLTSHDRRFVETVTSRFLLIAEGRLRELHDPSAYHDRAAAFPTEAVATAAAADGAAAPPARDDPEVLLERLTELEGLLADDRARKPKFQKPERQAAWAAEIETLYSRLDAV